MSDYTDALIASILVSLLIGVSGMVLLCKYTVVPRKKHLMNIFSQIFFALLFTGSLVRSLTWIIWAFPGTKGASYKDDLATGVPMGLKAFIITYPQINILICAFLIQYPWLYDFILIQNGVTINLVLRQ